MAVGKGACATTFVDAVRRAGCEAHCVDSVGQADPVMVVIKVVPSITETGRV